MENLNLAIFAPVTDHMELYIVRKGSDKPQFFCRVDVVGKLVTASVPKTYANSFVELVQAVKQDIEDHDVNDVEQFALFDGSKKDATTEEWRQKECASEGDEELVYNYSPTKHRLHLVEIGPLRKLLRHYDDDNELCKSQFEYLMGRSMLS